MVKNKLVPILGALILTIGIGATVIVSAADDNAGQVSPGTSSSGTSSSDTNASDKGNWKIKKNELTDEEKEELKAKFEERKAQIEEQKAKWDALDESAKSEIYDINGQIGDLQKELIDKYLANGLIDEEQAAAMKEKLDQTVSETEENGEMPMLNGRCGKGRDGKGFMKDKVSSDDNGKEAGTDATE